ncbi:MAG TPA: hypothetical protein VF494_05280 [Candidatus Limnocylindrales bacterium]
MTSYEITPAERGLKIELAHVGDKEGELLAAFGECQAGQCSCPTDEYDKVADMTVEPSPDGIRIELVAKPGAACDTAEIAACLDYTVDKAGGQTVS